LNSFDEEILSGDEEMILVTGASGNVGGQVLDAVMKGGSRVKALYRSEKDAGSAGAGAQIAIADFSDRASMDRALQGVDQVFLVCGPVPELVELESKAIEACRAAGVQHVVLNSALGAGVFDASFPRWHAEVEKVLAASGLRYSIIRPNSFMQNIVNYFAPTIRTQGAFYSSMGKARVSFIDTRDIGAFVAKLFANPAHWGKTYELNGPEALTYAEVAELVTRSTGVPARYVDIPVAQQRQAMLDQGMPAWQVDALVDLQRYYTEGRGGEVDSVFADVVGRQPVRLAEFLKEFAGRLRSTPGESGIKENGIKGEIA
jgi:uncharacterized protein YbjT (DUF2867 family)